jgi:creatinine amidohydrolase/Fe(II)-dependent formamide hydrolase-like protein
VLRATTEAIARKLGDALVAPIVPFVPEGDIDPPTLHMRYPSTISVTEGTYRVLLTEVCACLRAHGFRRIVLIGDSGGNQKGMEAVAGDLNAKWSDGRTRIYYIREYYNYPEVAKWLEAQGIQQTDEGLHDDFAITAQMAAVDPNSVRAGERIQAGKFRINGVDLAPVEKTAAWGRKIAEYRAEATIAALRRAMGSSK